MDQVATSKAEDLCRINAAIEPHVTFSDARAIVAHGDSLALLQKLPGSCVSLILTDPPYHTTKKRNIFGDTAFAEDEHYLDWIAQYAAEWRRVLRPNGSLYCFCHSSMAARLEIILTKSFNVRSRIVWTKPNDPGFDGWKGKMKKEALRHWYPHSERIIFAEPAVDGNLFRSPFADFLRTARTAAGLTMHQLTARIGAHGKVNHGGAVSNWEDGRNTPSREQYEKICAALIETGKIQGMPPYEDVIRVFNIDASKEFTDVWTFPSVRPYDGKHPAEKPDSLLRHAIQASTYPGDVVLDCFGGGGGTALSAINTGRRAVVMEIENQWVKEIAARVKEASEQLGSSHPVSAVSIPVKRPGNNQTRQLPLFAAGK